MLKKIQKEVENLRIKVYVGQSLEGTEKALYEIEQMLFKAMDKQLNIPIVVECKSYEFKKTIDLLDAEIDSLKDAYHQETIIDRKTVYSSMILETIKAKNKLME